MTQPTSNRIKRGSEPARNVFGPALFDSLPKAVLGRVAYQLARHSGPDGADVGDAAAKKRLLEVWDELTPEGLPLPSAQDRAALQQDREQLLRHMGL